MRINIEVKIAVPAPEHRAECILIYRRGAELHQEYQQHNVISPMLIYRIVTSPRHI